MERLHAIVRRYGRGAARALVLCCVLSAKYITCDAQVLDCAHAARQASDGVTVLVCGREYRRTGDPRTGARFANAVRRSGELGGAAVIAIGVLATGERGARGDALQVLGKIAISEDRLEAGRGLLERARMLHVTALDHAQVAKDDHALANVFDKQKQFAEALRALDSCLVESRLADDRMVEGFCHTSVGTVLAEVGYFERAVEELERAEALATTDLERTAIASERGGLEQLYSAEPLHHHHHALAVTELEKAIAYARRAGRPGDEAYAQINLANSLAELGRTQEAAVHLDVARVLDVDGSGEAERAMVSARIAYHSGSLSRARSLNNRVYPQLEDSDDRVRVAATQARIALAVGDLDDAHAWAQRGIDVVEDLRRKTSAVELRPWMLSARREPYELAFTALARGHKIEDAVVAFDRWQGRTLLDSLARARQSAGDLRTVAAQTASAHEVFPMLSSAPLTQPADRTVLLDQLRGVELVALLLADERVWRISARHGALALEDVGALDELQAPMTQLRAHPTDARLANQLGARLLGSAAFRVTPEVLYVVLDGRLANLPVAALRAGGGPLVALRPVVRAPRISELACVPRSARPRTAVVLGDPNGDLPDAAREAREVAKLLAAVPQIGPSATRRALLSAGHDEILHVAAHANVPLGVGSLELYDQAISALEISALSRGPAMVVLSACVSATSDDGEQAMSLGYAFLAAGSPQVVATLRPVEDRRAYAITTAFYRQHGVDDPARMLARVQAALADTDNEDWPYFVMLGHPTCEKDIP